MALSACLKATMTNHLDRATPEGPRLPTLAAETTCYRRPESDDASSVILDEAAPPETRRTCPNCRTLFHAKRPNQSYCGRTCQKNATRGPRAGNLSSDQRDDNRRDWSLLCWLNKTYYNTRPDERLGLVKDWLDAARDGDARLGRVLSKPAYRAPYKDDRIIFFRRCWAYPPVPLMADLFCQKLRRCRVWEWVNGSAPEPDSKEVTG